MSTKFSFEVPINHLDDFDDLQDFYFTLSLLYKHPEYTEYILNRKHEGLKTVWLDNSFNETFKADSVNTLVHLARALEVDKVISPDSPDWDSSQIIDAYFEMTKFIPSSKVIVVVSSPQMASLAILRGAISFAVSYWVRPRFTEYQSWFEMCHFLGLLSHREILEYRPKSCDTSMPIKLALQGKDISQWISEGCPHINTKDLGFQGQSFFEHKMSDQEIELARNNIRDLKEVCKW